MTPFDRLREGVHYSIGETVDPFGLVWWVYSCTTEKGCEFRATRASAVHADMSIREHIVGCHVSDKRRALVQLADMADHLGEPT